MFDRIVLGFLMERAMTGYEIKKTMEKSTNFFFNTSFGNIYPTLKKLEDAGHLLSNEEIKNGKLNKTYSITDSGRQVFKEWLCRNSEIAMIRDEALVRVFFFSYLNREQIENELDSYIARLTSQIEMMVKLEAKYKKFDIDQWRMETLSFGIDYYTYIKTAYIKMLQDFKDGKKGLLHKKTDTPG